MEIFLWILVGVYVYLSIKTIKVQDKRLKKLESFVEDYLGGKNEQQLQKRNSKDVQSVDSTDKGRHRAS